MQKFVDFDPLADIPLVEVILHPEHRVSDPLRQQLQTHGLVDALVSLTARQSIKNSSSSGKFSEDFCFSLILKMMIPILMSEDVSRLHPTR